MPEVSKITKGGVTYDIKDEYTRQHIGSGVTFEVVGDTPCRCYVADDA